MKITLFTSNKFRHIFLINFLSKICKELFVIQECGTIFPGSRTGTYQESEVIKKYFENVAIAEKKIFGESFIKSKNIKLLTIGQGDLNDLRLKNIKPFLQSKLYIVFGSSYIKGKLVSFLIKNKAINIHMGISPYYRGTDCNFWALYDGNASLVGATIHYLSKGLDNGKILLNATSEFHPNPFIYTMSTVKSAFLALKNLIKHNKIRSTRPIKHNKILEIRYSRKKDFNENTIRQFNKKKIKFKKQNFILHNNYILSRKSKNYLC
jgi:folate-dependent phosphoribosylglycinamide formyltransferase PurN